MVSTVVQWVAHFPYQSANSPWLHSDPPSYQCNLEATDDDPLTWKTHMKFLDPSSGLTQPWLLQALTW